MARHSTSTWGRSRPRGCVRSTRQGSVAPEARRAGTDLAFVAITGETFAQKARESRVSSTVRPKVAFIGTGGTISSLGVHPLELQDYGVHNNRLQASGIVDKFSTVKEIADVIPVDFRNVPSTEIYFAEWQELAGICGKLAKEHSDLAGIVIGHGTATLEE